MGGWRLPFRLLCLCMLGGAYSFLTAPTLIIVGRASSIRPLHRSGLGVAEGYRHRPNLHLASRLCAPALRAASGVGGSSVSEAIRRCRDAVAKKPDNEEAWFLLGVLLQESGDQPGALNAYSKSVVLNVSREEAWLNLAYLQRSSSPPSAVAACMGALKANPKSHRAYTLLGDAMGFAGRADAALQAYAAAIKAEPKWAQAHCGLVRALIAGGTLDSAREAAERGAKACPDDASVHCTVGLAMLELGRSKDATRSFEHSISLDPFLGDSHNGLGVALRREGKNTAAEASYTRAAELLPGSAEPHYNLAVLYTETKNSEKAIESLRRALAFSPFDQRCLTMMASLTGTGRSVSQLPPGHARELFDSIADAYEIAVIPGVGYTGVQSLAAAAISCGVPIPPPAAFSSSGGSGATLGASVARVGGGGIRQSELGDFFSGEGGRRASPGGGGLNVADIGCGTGLCGVAFAKAAGSGGRLVGCDVSGRMVAQARGKGVYDAVEQCDASAFLATFAGGQLDLITAADVLPYVGDLGGLFESASKALKKEALFAFTTEEMAGGKYPESGFGLNQYTRYCHSEAYVTSRAAEFGMAVEKSSPCALRMQGTSPVPARVYCLRRR